MEYVMIVESQNSWSMEEIHRNFLMASNVSFGFIWVHFLSYFHFVHLLTTSTTSQNKPHFDFQIDNFRSINIEKNKCNGEKMQWWLYWWRQVILSENDGFVDAGSRFATFHQCWPQIGSNGFLIWIRRMEPNM